MADNHTPSITFKVPGRHQIDQPTLPSALHARMPAAGSVAEDPFPPHDYLRPVAAFDLSARGMRLASGNFDAFLPSLLSLIDPLPAIAKNAQ